MKQRIFSILIAFDVFAFSLITFGHARRNETASSAAYRLEQQGDWQGKLFRPLIDWMFAPLQKDHCFKAYLQENRVDLWNPKA